MNTIRKLTTGILILLLFLTGACSESGLQQLRLGTNIWPGYEPLYLAGKLENWSEAEIRLIEYPSTTEVLRAFRNRALEAASLTLDEALLLKQDNIPIKVVLVHDISDGGDVIIAKPGIKTMQQLKGKKIGVESNALGAFVITRALELNNMSLTDVDIQPTDLNSHYSAFSTGKIDAVVTFEPVRTRLLNDGANQIFSSKEMSNEIVDVLVVHEDYLNQNAAHIKKLIKGWFDAVNYLKHSPENAAEIISKRLNISPSEVIAGYEGMHIPDLKENLVLLNQDKPALDDTAQKLARALEKHKLIRPDVNINNLFTDQFLPK